MLGTSIVVCLCKFYRVLHCERKVQNYPARPSFSARLHVQKNNSTEVRSITTRKGAKHALHPPTNFKSQFYNMSAMLGYASAEQVPRQQPLHDSPVLLPLGFTPTNRDVICGRARENFHHGTYMATAEERRDLMYASCLAGQQHTHHWCLQQI
jgi:hypothetical protein